MRPTLEHNETFQRLGRVLSRAIDEADSIRDELFRLVDKGGSARRLESIKQRLSMAEWRIKAAEEALEDFRLRSRIVSKANP